MDPRTNHDGVSFRHTLLELLESDPPNEERLLAEFEGQGSDADRPLYSTILYILTHLTFPEAEAERHWRKIRAHRDQHQGPAAARPRACGWPSSTTS